MAILNSNEAINMFKTLSAKSRAAYSSFKSYAGLGYQQYLNAADFGGLRGPMGSIGTGLAGIGRWMLGAGATGWGRAAAIAARMGTVAGGALLGGATAWDMYNLRQQNLRAPNRARMPRR